MKIFISYKISKEISGGGNQFLKSFKEMCIENHCYTSDPEKADICLFNSHQYILGTLLAKQLKKELILIHRIDGPICLYNFLTDKRDAIVNTINQYFADGSIFQSEWSKVQNCRMGLKITPFNTVIQNAPDTNIFNKDHRIQFSTERKVRIVSVSWSHNWKKGFKVYQWLDRNLDFSKYEMTFIGNSPVKFLNVKHIKPLSSKALSDEFKKNDIFITASQKDPCSNALIEAMHCGLPCIALKDGGHPEIIADSGELFENATEIPSVLERICNNYEYYQNKINPPAMKDVWDQYFNFMRKIHNSLKKREFIPKRLTVKGILNITLIVLWSKIYPKLKY